MKTRSLLNSILLMMLCTFICCSKNEQKNTYQIMKDSTPDLTKTIYGGCFSHKSYKSILDEDTIYYNVNKDTLLLHLNVRKNCSDAPSDSVVTDSENINIYIRATRLDLANCDCDWEFNYSFTNFSSLKHFNVYFKEYKQIDYLLWGTLTYP
jgi:hypothetical protein